MASLFTSIQQVETEIRKEQETAEQHNRNKALSNLRKARFMKQMQNLTKKLKEQTILTHSYPMPKPTNATELTKKLLHDSPDEVPIPDINKDLEEELTKLGLNITPLRNTNSPTNKGTLENTPRCKRSIPPSSTSTVQESTTIVCTGKPNHQYEETKELTSQNSFQQQEVQESTAANKNECTEKVTNIGTKQPPRKNSNEPPNNLQTPKLPKQPPRKTSSDPPSQLQPLKLNHNDHIEAYPWAHEASKNFHKTTPLAGQEEEVEFLNISYRSLPNNLTTAQKEQMRQPIALTDAALRKIDEHIGMKTKNKNCIFFCKVCDDTTPHEFQRKTKCRRHVRMHLGYSFYRCSFCNFISNNLTSIHLHYISTHGIPKKWIDSHEIKN